MALYLITGIAGFIGSSIARELARRGENVRGLDNFSTGNRENLISIRDNIEFFEGDLLDLGCVAETCCGVDYVIHQAAIPSVPLSVADPLLCNRSNVDGTLNLLVAARDAGVRRIVYASSSSLYGDTPTLPKTENMAPNPISPYAVSKLAGEYYVRSFHSVYGLETVSLRYFNVFGPYQDPRSMYTGVMAIFIPKMLSGEQPVIFGDGEQSRDFTFVENVVNANLLACAAPADLVAGKCFNIASGRPVTINETYASLQVATGYSSAAKFVPERLGDIRHSYADIRAAAKALRYETVVSFEDGLRRTVEWYRQHLEREAMVK